MQSRKSLICLSSLLLLLAATTADAQSSALLGQKDLQYLGAFHVPVRMNDFANPAGPEYGCGRNWKYGRPFPGILFR